MNTNSAKGKDDTVKMQCKQCEYHVYFHKRIPGLVELEQPSEEPKYAYLTCDNPSTPHTNKYEIP